MIIDFKKEAVEKFDQHYFDIHLKKCPRYTILQNEKEIGLFYFTNQIAFGKIDGFTVEIRAVKPNWRDTVYTLTDLTKKTTLGKFTISNWVLGKTRYAQIEMEGYNNFEWEVLESKYSANLMYSETKSKFSARLLNDRCYLTFKWDYQNR